MATHIGIVVVSYNSELVIKDLLASLPDALAGMSATIVVVDNGSTDSTVSILSAREDIQLIQSRNLGYAAGINRGVRECLEYDEILILNPDVVLQPGSIPAMRRVLACSSVGIVAPRLLDSEGRLTKSLRREPTFRRSLGLGFTGIAVLSEYVSEDSEYSRPCTVDWAVGAVLMIRRKCFEELGGWDESFFLYSEETDFCLRSRDRGWRTMFEPTAVAVHVAGASGRNGQTHSMQVLNQVRLYSRRNGRGASWAFFGITVVAEFSRVARRQPHSRRALIALLSPSRRPPELRLANKFLPSDPEGSARDRTSSWTGSEKKG